jgi:precorrin-6A/cobalt-precorrin-6A reductase
MSQNLATLGSNGDRKQLLTPTLPYPNHVSRTLESCAGSSSYITCAFLRAETNCRIISLSRGGAWEEAARTAAQLGETIFFNHRYQ